MKIDCQQAGDIAVVHPSGPLAGDDVDRFRAELSTLVRDGQGRVVLDASAIPYADSKGLEALLDATDLSTEVASPLKIVSCTDSLGEALDIMEISAAFEHFDDLDSALRSFA